MRRSSFFLLALWALAFYACKPATAPVANPQPILRHVVMFKFKADATPEQVAATERAFANLKTELSDLIRDFEYGTNNSPEGLTEGLTHCFLVSFASEKDRDTYLPHPKHQAFVDEYAKKYVEKAVVLDYWAK